MAVIKFFDFWLDCSFRFLSANRYLSAALKKREKLKKKPKKKSKKNR